MKELFNNRYFKFGVIYLCILSLIGVSLSFSRFTSGDAEGDSGDAAIYDVEIYSGELTERVRNISISVCATCKISEPETFVEGVYAKRQINIFNYSECDINISNLTLTADCKDFEILVLPMEADEMTAYEESCGSMASVVLDYLGKDGDSASDLADAEDVREAVDDKNSDSLSEIDCTLQSGETKTFFIVAWVEHDDIYLEDATQSTDSISHNTLEALDKGEEEFEIRLLSEQAD